MKMTPALARLLVADRKEKPTATVRIPRQRSGEGRHVRTRPGTGVRSPKR